MTRAALWLHVLLCGVALCFAWQSAHEVKVKKGGPSSVVLLEAAKGDVVDVLYTWDKGSTHTTLEGSDKARAAIVEVDREVPAPKVKEPKKADAAAVPEPLALPAVVAQAEREQATLPGGKGVLTAIEALEPFKTKRTLGAVDDAKLEAMGLKAPLRSLVIQTRNGRTLTLELGEQSFGAQGRYARVKGETTVHLIDAAIATGLEGGADALLEKRLLTAELESISGYTLEVGAETRTFVHVDKDQATKRFFARKDDAAVKDDAAGKLMTTVRNLRGTKLASPDTVSSAGAAAAVFVIDVENHKTKIEIFERGPSEGHQAKVGRFVFELTATQSKELLDDIQAATGT